MPLLAKTTRVDSKLYPDFIAVQVVNIIKEKSVAFYLNLNKLVFLFEFFLFRLALSHSILSGADRNTKKK